MGNRLIIFAAALGFGVLCESAQAQPEYGPWAFQPNYFSTPSAVPHGCFPAVAAAFQMPSEAYVYDQTFDVSFEGFSDRVRVRAGRFSCPEPGRSAILLNLEYSDAGDFGVIYPFVRINTPTNEEIDVGLFYQSQTSPLDWLGAVADVPLSQAIFPEGVTYIVDGIVDPEIYNGPLGLNVEFTGYQDLTIQIPDYDPQTSVGFSETALHGRYSGQWVSSDLPSTGLQLQIGEVGLDRTFVFAIWFTYLNGEPFWVVANSDFQPGASEITLDLLQLDGGAFITEPGSYSSDDINVRTVGTMSIRPIHCNKLAVDLDFTEVGLGTQSYELDRLIRIAGYDCDQTQ